MKFASKVNLSQKTPNDMFDLFSVNTKVCYSLRTQYSLSVVLYHEIQ